MKTTTKRVGRTMAAVQAFVNANPGRAMMAAAGHAGPNGSLNYGYRSVHRAIRAGLVWAVRGANGQTRLYPVAAVGAS